MSRRLKFFTAHLSISFLVLSLAALMVFQLWYPQPLATLTGVVHIFLLLLVIDVVLGPSFTLLVYKEGKKSLKFDLAVIILIQISAFVYGFYNIATTRPAWMVFYNNGFELARANQIPESALKDAAPDFKTVPWFGPQYTAALASQDKSQHSKDIFEASFGITLPYKPDRYVPLAQTATEFRASAKDLSILYNFNHKDKVNALLKQYPDTDAWLPLRTGQKDGVVLVSKAKIQAIQVVDLQPSQL